MIHNTISSPPLRCSLAGDSLVSCFVEKGDRLRSVFEGSRYSGTMIFRINLVRVTTDRSAVLLGLTQPKWAQKLCSCCSRATWPALYFQGMNQAEEDWRAPFPAAGAEHATGRRTKRLRSSPCPPSSISIFSVTFMSCPGNKNNVGESFVSFKLAIACNGHSSRKIWLLAQKD